MLLCVKQNQSIFMVFLFENFDDIYSDAGRLVDCRARMNFCPLGACALAGTGLPIDRFMTSEALGFTAPLRNRYLTSFYFV